MDIIEKVNKQGLQFNKKRTIRGRESKLDFVQNSRETQRSETIPRLRVRPKFRVGFKNLRTHYMGYFESSWI